MAVELPESIKADLVNVQKQMDTKSAKLVFVRPEHMHVTLRFLGEVSEFQTGKLCSTLEQVNVRRFPTGFTGFGFFPDRNYLRVFWIGLSGSQWYDLANEIEKNLSQLGFRTDERFTPHLTVARIKFVQNRTAFLESVDRIKPPKAEFEVCSFKLKNSVLTPEGPVYTDIAAYPLSD